MQQVTKILLFMAMISVAIGCNSNASISSSNETKLKESKFFKLYPDFSTHILVDRLQSKITNDKQLNALYSDNSYIPVWFRDTLNIQYINELSFLLNNIDKHGVPIEIFPIYEIESIVRDIDNGEYQQNADELYNKLTELEQLASKSVLRYVEGMHFGFLDPKELYGNDYSIRLSKADEAFYSQLYKDIYIDPIATMHHYEPKDSVYLLLQHEYLKLDSLKQIDIKKIQSKGKLSYKLFDRSENIVDIVKRLSITGEYIPDTVGINSSGYILDSELLIAVNKFRRANSYPEEDEIGNLTIDALNRPLTYYQDAIRLNMERYRWKKIKHNNSKHIEVNIASQLLIASEGDKNVLEMAVAVGSVKHMTPFLQSDISYINLNPIWNVPISIARNELSVKQKNNPSYLKRNSMRIYKAGKEVDIDSVDWDNIDPATFSYSIKQSAGDGNALGKLKFMFNNNFAVYLHDTPSKASFKRKNRAISHGCIRLQKPIDLALFCTDPNDQRYADRLYHTISLKAPSDEGRKLQAENKLTKIDDIIKMKESISLTIDYQTVFMKPSDNTLYYADDVYEYDNLIADGLAKLKDKYVGVKKKTSLVAENK